MEKEKEDVTSPRGVLEACVRSFEDPSNSSEENQINESVSPPRSRWLKFFNKWKKGFSKKVPALPPTAPKTSRRKSMSVRESHPDVNLCHFKSSWKVLSIAELNAATNNFSEGMQLLLFESFIF